MSLKSASYYWVECDDCNIKASYGCDIEAWRQEFAAYEDAENAEFVEVASTTDEPRHYCLTCAEKRGLFDEDVTP